MNTTSEKAEIGKVESRKLTADGQSQMAKPLPRRPSRAAEERDVREWNRKYPVGTTVEVLKDDGARHRGKTLWPASMMGERVAVAWVEGISGAYRLNRVRAVSEG
jgi:hypothetical protein